MNKHKTAKKERKTKVIALAIVLAIVVGSIYYLNSQKAGTGIGGDNVSLDINPPDNYIRDEEAIKSKESQFIYAPELNGIGGYINTQGISIGSLKGKVVLVDFWTYTCINCIRTLPYLKAWHDKYGDDGLVIIGVHTPEFEFEKEYENVVNAVNDNGIRYAVVQDNDYATWRAYQNRYWPRKYLIDIDGFIRYDHIGEGKYEETEKAIQELLKERMERVGDVKFDEDMSKPSDVQDVDFGKVKTPELYLGYDFARQDIGNVPGIQAGQAREYTLPVRISPNVIYLDGTWKFNADDAELVSDEGMIVLGYDAKSVNIVASSDSGSAIEVLVDTMALNSSKTGKDIELIDGKSIATIGDGRLYSLVDYEYGPGLLELRIRGKGFRINTFTFG